MKPSLLLLAGLTTLLTANTTHAGAGALGGASIAAGAAVALVKGDTATKALAAGGAAIVGGMVGNYIENKAKQRQLEAYMLGRYQEAYIRAYSPWYKATLNPTTGRPPAFDGYWAMDIGLPDQTAIQPQPTTRTVSTTRQPYEDSLPKVIEKREEEIARAAATSEIISRRRVVNGVEYAAQRVVYPRLPARR